jgi:hypothetical protein
LKLSRTKGHFWKQEKYSMNSERVAPSVKKKTHLSSSSDSIFGKKGIEE